MTDSFPSNHFLMFTPFYLRIKLHMTDRCHWSALLVKTDPHMETTDVGLPLFTRIMNGVSVSHTRHIVGIIGMFETGHDPPSSAFLVLSALSLSLFLSFVNIMRYPPALHDLMFARPNTGRAAAIVGFCR